MFLHSWFLAVAALTEAHSYYCSLPCVGSTHPCCVRILHGVITPEVCNRYTHGTVTVFPRAALPGPAFFFSVSLVSGHEGVA